MNLIFQAFGGETFRPQPTTLLNNNLGLFAIITPWGPSFQTKNLTEVLLQNFETYSSDAEVTNVFAPLSCLSTEENLLRTILLSFNKYIYEELNKTSEYTFGYEIVCGLKRGNQILFSQTGHPHTYLDREGIPLQPLGHVLDLAGGFSRLSKELPPLPSQLIGIHSEAHFSIFSIPIKEQDRLIFISRSFVPTSALTINRKERNLEHISHKLSEDNEKFPFWLGIFDPFAPPS